MYSVVPISKETIVLGNTNTWTPAIKGGGGGGCEEDTHVVIWQQYRHMRYSSRIHIATEVGVRLKVVVYLEFQDITSRR